MWRGIPLDEKVKWKLDQVSCHSRVRGSRANATSQSQYGGSPSPADRPVKVPLDERNVELPEVGVGVLIVVVL
jgi:hypothetical protein